MPLLDQGTRPTCVAVIADTLNAAEAISRSLCEAGYSARPFSFTAPRACDRLLGLRPPVALVRTSSRNFARAAAFTRGAAHKCPPLVLLTPKGSPDAMKLARDTGALVHLVEPAPVQALEAAITVAIARARELRELAGQLKRTRELVRQRKILDRAKAVLMRRFGLTEEAAHRSLQRESRNRNRRLIDTAWHVIRADAALGGRRSFAGPPARTMLV
jgi:response regulator NasT